MDWTLTFRWDLEPRPDSEARCEVRRSWVEGCEVYLFQRTPDLLMRDMLERDVVHGTHASFSGAAEAMVKCFAERRERNHSGIPNGSDD